MRMNKNWVYGSYGLLLILEVILLIWTAMLVYDPLFSLIPIDQQNPWILIFSMSNMLQAILCVIAIFALYRNSMQLLSYCHWTVCFTLMFDCAFPFIFSSLMSNVHVNIHGHIAYLYTGKNENCEVWEDVYHRLKCCPPAFALLSCNDMLNVSKTYCPLDDSNTCKDHLRIWLLNKTEVVGLFAFCIIALLKLFMFCALGKDIEKVSLELEEQLYFSQMVNEINRHGDGYIDSFKSRSNLVLNTVVPDAKVRSVSQYSPYVRPSVIEEVEYEFTVRGDELREQLQHAMAAHSPKSTEL